MTADGQLPADDDERWRQFYAHTAGREPRALLVEALHLLGPGDGRQAVDLGCGDGTDTLEMLRRGWRVLAVDGHPMGLATLRSRLDGAAGADRVEIVQAPMVAVLPLPAASLVHAGFSLPYCAPGDFRSVFEGVRRALAPGGLFAGQLFGDRDTWFGTPGMTFHARAEVEALLAGGGWADVEVREREEDGTSGAGPKHWHVYDVLARA
jgi:SAM-dependent methyltransferase